MDENIGKSHAKDNHGDYLHKYRITLTIHQHTTCAFINISEFAYGLELLVSLAFDLQFTNPTSNTSQLFKMPSD